MSGDTGRARGLRELMLVARRELVVRVRGTAFRLSTIILLAVTVAGIAVAAALTGHPQRFTVAVTAQAPPAVAASVRADGRAAGLQVTAVPAAGRAAAVRSVEQGRVTAAVAAGGEIIWKAQPNSALHPLLTAAVQQAIITQRATSLGLSAAATARLLAPVRLTVTQLHSQSQRTARTIIAYISVLLLFMAISRVRRLRADRGGGGEVEPGGGGAAVPDAADVAAGRQDRRDRAGRARPVRSPWRPRPWPRS